MNEILRFMQKRDEQTYGRTDVRKAFYNLPTTAFGRRREIIMPHKVQIRNHIEIDSFCINIEMQKLS